MKKVQTSDVNSNFSVGRFERISGSITAFAESGQKNARHFKGHVFQNRESESTAIYADNGRVYLLHWDAHISGSFVYEDIGRYSTSTLMALFNHK